MTRDHDTFNELLVQICIRQQRMINLLVDELPYIPAGIADLKQNVSSSFTELKELLERNSVEATAIRRGGS